ncbi:hypothetical protein V3C99_009839 [Haemonchus contortus]
MIIALLLLTSLFNNSLCLSEKARIALTKAYGGIDIDERHERLKNLGLSVSEQKPLSEDVGLTAIVDVTPEKETVTGGSIPADDDTILGINQREGIDEYLFDGDMMLTEEQLSAYENSVKNPTTRQKRQVTRPLLRWPNKMVYYFFDSSISATNQDFIRTQLKYVSDRTCIKFVENATAGNVIKVVSGAGCSSFVGIKGGEQALSLGSGCVVAGTVVHEFMHALGVQHMQQRGDRDQFIIVNLTNVNPDVRYNFQKDTSLVNHTPYEYGSVMQYATIAFSSSGNSMTPRTAGFGRTMGSQVVSFFDIRMINIFYQCNVLCNGHATTAKCLNGGAPNPRNCKVCLCPLGYGGGLCGQRKPGCGAALVAIKTWKARTITIVRNDTSPTSDAYVTCNDWITAPAGKKIQIRIMTMTNVTCRNGCTANAIEPRVMVNKAITNRRLCCAEELNTIRTSNISPTPVVAYTNSNVASTFMYHYRFI